jgi:hypothetical protein
MNHHTQSSHQLNYKSSNGTLKTLELIYAATTSFAIRMVVESTNPNGQWHIEALDGCLWIQPSTSGCKSQDSKRAYDAAPQATATFSRQWMSTATAT